MTGYPNGTPHNPPGYESLLNLKMTGYPNTMIDD